MRLPWLASLRQRAALASPTSAADAPNLPPDQPRAAPLAVHEPILAPVILVRSVFFF